MIENVISRSSAGAIVKFTSQNNTAFKKYILLTLSTRWVDSMNTRSAALKDLETPLTLNFRVSNDRANNPQCFSAGLLYAQVRVAQHLDKLRYDGG